VDRRVIEDLRRIEEPLTIAAHDCHHGLRTKGFSYTALPGKQGEQFHSAI